MSVEGVAAVLILAYSIILHEVMHGAVAHSLGDPTARRMGRLTLNPIPHIDPVGTLILPLALVLAKAPFFIGWAKPVPFDPRYFAHRRAGVIGVALAGPATNFLLAGLFAAVFRISAEGPMQKVFFYGVSLNLMLGLFNLLPLPPLDGSRVLAMLLPQTARRAFLSLEKAGFLIVVVLLYFGLLHRVLVPAYVFLARRLLG